MQQKVICLWQEIQQALRSQGLLNSSTGTAGGEAQQADIKQLLKELELKKAKLNELKGESRKNESAIAKIRDDDTDAQRLTPDDNIDENSYIQVGSLFRHHTAAPCRVSSARWAYHPRHLGNTSEAQGTAVIWESCIVYASDVLSHCAGLQREPAAVCSIVNSFQLLCWRICTPSMLASWHLHDVCIITVQELRDEMTRVEEDLLEADAKNRLYYLLGERTRREHMAIDQKVRWRQLLLSSSWGY
eukprot:GHUV01039918.1.p1 GENE.GHUV01039918.1~~GHUV01039918.1.p1  ORF type:complete len:245 (+),score=71.35 GHUV01039918.1:584-1318(+)